MTQHLTRNEVTREMNRGHNKSATIHTFAKHAGSSAIESTSPPPSWMTWGGLGGGYRAGPGPGSDIYIYIYVTVMLASLQNKQAGTKYSETLDPDCVGLMPPKRQGPPRPETPNQGQLQLQVTLSKAEASADLRG